MFLSKLSKKSEKTPLNLKNQSNKSRNIGCLKDIGGNSYNNNQPCRTRNDVIGYELSSSNSYQMAGRTMVNQINTPTKYSAIHGKGTGIFTSYNRNIPKNNLPQNNRIRINDFCSDSNKKNKNKTCSKIRTKEEGSYKSHTQGRSVKNVTSNKHENYTDGYSQKVVNKDYKKDRAFIMNKQNNITYKNDDKKDLTNFRVRSASSSKKYRYNNNATDKNSPGHRITSGKKKKKKLLKGNYGEPHWIKEKDDAQKVSKIIFLILNIILKGNTLMCSSHF